MRTTHPDPNPDLVGYRFRDEDGRCLTVTGTETWSTQYVRVEDGDGFVSSRGAALLRQHRRLS